MLARIVFYLIAAPVTVVLCLVVPLLCLGIMLLCPLGFVYSYLFHPRQDAAPSPLANEHQHAGV